MNGEQARGIVLTRRPVFGDAELIKADRLCVLVDELVELQGSRVCEDCLTLFSHMDEKELRYHAEVLLQGAA